MKESLLHPIFKRIVHILVLFKLFSPNFMPLFPIWQNMFIFSQSVSSPVTFLTSANESLKDIVFNKLYLLLKSA